MREDQLIEIVAGAIGQELAQKAVEAIMDEFGGEIHWMPRPCQKHSRERNRQIRELYRNNSLDLPGLAERFGLSESQIRRILGD
jgi:Mor family transcriptional regulator